MEGLHDRIVGRLLAVAEAVIHSNGSSSLGALTVPLNSDSCLEETVHV